MECNEIKLDYDCYLKSYLNGYSYQQMSIFKEIDVIEETDIANNVYLNYAVLHRDEFIDYFNKTSHFLLSDLPLPKEEFVEVYDEFHKTYAYKNIKEDKKSRYAVQLKLLFPKGLIDHNKRKAFIKEYIKQAVNLKVDLPYVVEEIYTGQGKATYALITLIERSYIGDMKYKVYINDKYMDSRTNQWASKDCPSKYKMHKCKKRRLPQNETRKAYS